MATERFSRSAWPCLSASLGLLLGEDVPQLILKFVFVSQRFFLLIVHCLLQKQRLGS